MFSLIRALKIGYIFCLTLLINCSALAGWSSLISPTSQNLNSTSFRSGSVFYIAGNNGEIYKTTDGGASWTAQSSGTSNCLKSIFFIDDDIGCTAGCNGTIVRTTDGGSTWTAQNSQTSQTIESACFYDSNLGALVGTNGTIRHTTDGGANWNIINVPTSESLFSVYYVTSSVVLAAGGDGSILRSVDGGANWTLLSSTQGRTYTSMVFTDDNTGYIAGEAGKLLKTTDGGAAWTDKTTGTNRHLFSICFTTDPNIGFAVGNYGTIITTSDAGESWTVQNPGESYGLNDVFFTDANAGFIVGNGGRMMTTSDAGAGAEEDITLNSPNGGEHWINGSYHNITWAAANITNNIKIEYSTNNGASWITAATVPASNLYYSWQIPNAPSANALIRVSDRYHPGVADESADVFTIAASEIVLTAPNGDEPLQADKIFDIRWTTQTVANININFSSDGGTSWASAASNVPASNPSYPWAVPTNFSSQCRIRVTDVINPANTDMSDNNFSIEDVEITAPADGAALSSNSNYDVLWNSDNIQNVKIEYSIDAGVNWITIANAVDASTGSYTWAIPNVSAQAAMRISDAASLSVSDQNSFSVMNVSTITTTAPNGGESWGSGDAHNIYWTSANVDYVNIDYTTDNGQSWTNCAVNVIANLGYYSWTVPNAPSSECKVKITDAANPLILDISNDVFEIFDGTIPVLEVLSPNGGEEWLAGSSRSLTWNSYNIAGVTIEYSTDGGAVWNFIAGGVTASDHRYDWVVPGTPSIECFVRLTDDANPGFSDASDAPFSITDPTMLITLTSPNGAERWFAGSAYEITWESVNVSFIKLEYSVDAGVNWVEIARDIDAGQGVYNWTAPGDPGIYCKIRASCQHVPDVYDETDGAFMLVGVKLTSPNGGETLLFERSHPIVWTSAGVDNIRIEYTTDAGGAWTTLISSYPASAGLYSWTVPNTPSAQCLVRIMDTRRSALFDLSDVVFQITGIAIVSPREGDSWVAGMMYDILWDSQNVDNVKIEYSTNSGDSWITIISFMPSTGVYSWTAPQTPSDNCILKISDAADPNVYGSRSGFEIAGEGIFVSFPGGGETFLPGENRAITWTTINVNRVDVHFTCDDGYSWGLLAENLPASQGTLNWTVPNAPSVECRIRVSDHDLLGVYDECASNFRIGGAFFPPPVSWRYAARTGNNAVIVVPFAIDPMIGERPMQNEDAIGLFFRSNGALICAGWGFWLANNNFAVTVWADNVRTPVKDGFALNEKYIFKVWDAVLGLEARASPEYESGPERYAHNAISVLSRLKTYDELNIFLAGGLWSLISSNLVSHIRNMETLMSGVEEQMAYMKNDEGRVYYPAEDVNSIGNWNVKAGYQIYMDADATLTLTGAHVDVSEHSLTFSPLKWYIISYLPEDPMPITTAFASIADKLLMVKNYEGKIYFPQYNIDQILTMRPGEGYKAAAKSVVTAFYYPSGATTVRKETPWEVFCNLIGPVKYMHEIYGTGNNATLVIESTESDCILADGGETGVFNSKGKLIGSAAVIDGRAVATVWGDNKATPGVVEGALDDELLELRYWDNLNEKEYRILIGAPVDLMSGGTIDGSLRYRQDGVFLAQAASLTGNHETYEKPATGPRLSSAPNPFNGKTTILYSISEDGVVVIDVVDAEGRVVAALLNEMKRRGEYSIEFDAGKFGPSASYYCRLRHTRGGLSRNATLKMIRIK